MGVSGSDGLEDGGGGRGQRHKYLLGGDCVGGAGG